MYSEQIFAGCVLALSVVTSAPVSVWKPQCRGETYKIVSKLDCSGFYMCVWGEPVEMPCAPGTVFSSRYASCVLKGGIFDDCTPTIAPSYVMKQCAAGASIIPHPTECQLYYNCSAPRMHIPRNFEQYLYECTYPDLFSLETMQCAHFEDVNCGTRKENKNACDYITNKCPLYSNRFPSCEGLPDGANPNKMRPWTQYFVFCYKERLLAEQECARDPDNRPYTFSPKVSRCVTLDDVPRRHGGTKADCEEDSTGHFLDCYGVCDRYIICENGMYKGTERCYAGQVFDSVSGLCKSKEDACAPCGLRDDCN